MICDNPDAYINQPGFDFLQAVPLTWDETKVIDAKPSEFVPIARRKGNEWYVGAITNHDRADELSINLIFYLPEIIPRRFGAMHLQVIRI